MRIERIFTDLIFLPVLIRMIRPIRVPFNEVMQFERLNYSPMAIPSR